jgi:ribosome-interacting GTPase 1
LKKKSQEHKKIRVQRSIQLNESQNLLYFLATEYHLGLLKAKLAKCRQALLEGDAKAGSGKVRYN